MPASKLLISSMLLFASISVFAQDQTDQEKATALKNLVDSKHYLFIARNANPMKGKSIQLNGDYYLKMIGDSIDVFLPYYGRAYNADYGGSSESQGIQFKTKNFTYKSETTKKGGQDVTLEFKGQRSASRIFLSIGTSGYGTVSVNSNNRQPISFYGTFSAIPEKH